MNENKLVNAKALQEVGKFLKNYTDSSVSNLASIEYVDKKLANLNTNTIIEYDEVGEELLLDASFINVEYDEENENLSILGRDKWQILKRLMEFM